MSLIKQLWIAIALAMAAAFGISLTVNVCSSRDYLQQQLQLKNIDNATSLALSLSQLAKNPATVELLVSAQFDIGHYRYIRITSPHGKLLLDKTWQGELEGAPQWFARLIPIRVQPGQAQIQDGWRQYGTLTLASHDQYAYQSLWQGTLRLLGWFLLGIVVTGVLGTVALRLITRPLLDVVAQAQALAQRRFQPIAEPRTPELRAVAHAMNDMVVRIRTLFAEEAARIETLRDRINRDPVSGLASREHFLSQLRELLVGEAAASSGSLAIVRLTDLGAINDRLGHQRADQLLASLGALLRGDAEQGPAGRLKGAEFALACPGLGPDAAAGELQQRLLRDWLPQWQAELPDLFHLAAVRYERGQALAELLTRADQALAQAQALGPNACHAPTAPARFSLPAERWRELLGEAIEAGRLGLALFPVVKASGHLLHREAVLRLKVEPSGQLLSAGDFMPIAVRLKLSAAIDTGVVRQALSRLRESSGDLAVNLSAETVADFHFRNELLDLLAAHPAQCERLLFEVPEYGVSLQFDAFRGLAQRLKALGCRVGIEQFGLRLIDAERLASLGLDYVKVDPGYVRGIADSAGNREFLARLCAIVHALGIQAVAVGVEREQDLALLATLGFDGATGPGVRWSEAS